MIQQPDLEKLDFWNQILANFDFWISIILATINDFWKINNKSNLKISEFAISEMAKFKYRWIWSFMVTCAVWLASMGSAGLTRWKNPAQ